MNYKKLVDEQLKRFEKDVSKYFSDLFESIKIDQDKDYIETDHLIEVLGGKDVCDNDKRLQDLMW